MVEILGRRHAEERIDFSFAGVFAFVLRYQSAALRGLVWSVAMVAYGKGKSPGCHKYQRIRQRGCFHLGQRRLWAIANGQIDDKGICQSAQSIHDDGSAPNQGGDVIREVRT